jgi:hypothetical protein
LVILKRGSFFVVSRIALYKAFTASPPIYASWSASMPHSARPWSAWSCAVLSNPLAPFDPGETAGAAIDEPLRAAGSFATNKVEFMPRERSDHERRLAADDLKQAIEEVHQPIE